MQQTKQSSSAHQMKRLIAEAAVSPKKGGNTHRPGAKRRAGQERVQRGPSVGIASASKMLSLLDTFSVERPTLSVGELAKPYSLTFSTTYRYVKLLCGHGLLSSLGNGEYSLGPRAIELDRQIRMADPLLRLIPPHARRLLNLVELGVVVIYTLYDSRLVSAYQLRKPETLDISYERGQTIGLFRSAAAKVVLANFPRTRLIRIYGENHHELRMAGMGETLSSFLGKVKEILRRPSFETTGELDKRSHGFAAALFDTESRIVGSLNLIIPVEMLGKVDRDSLCHAVAEEAGNINMAMQSRKRSRKV